MFRLLVPSEGVLGLHAWHGNNGLPQKGMSRSERWGGASAVVASAFRLPLRVCRDSRAEGEPRGRSGVSSLAASPQGAVRLALPIGSAISHVLPR